MKAYKNRIIDPTKPVRVYRNLGHHVPEFWSIQQNGLVVAHCDNLTLEDCSFKVSESGRQNVIRNKRKAVHAYVIGFTTNKKPECNDKLSYNPYKGGNFVLGGQAVFAVDFVEFCRKGVFC